MNMDARCAESHPERSGERREARSRRICAKRICVTGCRHERERRIRLWQSSVSFRQTRISWSLPTCGRSGLIRSSGIALRTW